jgi:serine/threonine-protein kinase
MDGGLKQGQRDSPGLTSRVVRIDEACDRFEAHWGLGRRPSIESFLAEARGNERPDFFRELMALEIDLKRGAGEEPTAADYHDRFPELVGLVDDVFGQALRPTGSGPGPVDAPPGPEFGDFEILHELGRGGMGVVYQARQISLGRLVALKLIRDNAATDSNLDRFRNEAEAIAALNHPHIVPVLEFGRRAGFSYFSMKLLGGGSLAEKLDRYADDPKAIARLMVDIAEAVHHAHQRATLHRDLKPSNILLDEQERPFVGDFGLAKRLEVVGDLTETDALLGTPCYMAPEQAERRHRDVTIKTDVYGLGTILYSLLTGRAPFSGRSVADILRQVGEDDPERPSRLRPRVNRDLETICLRCLRKDPAGRYESAAAVADDLRLWLAGKPIAARPVGNSERILLWCRRRPALAGMAAALLAAVTIGGTLTVSGYRKANAQARIANNERDRANRRRIAAEHARDLARDAIAQFQNAVADHKELRNHRELDNLRRELLKAPLKYYRDLLDALKNDDDAGEGSQRDTALATLELARILQQIDSQLEALRAYAAAAEMFESLARHHRDGTRYSADLARCYSNTGLLHQAAGDFPAALDAFERTFRLREQLVRDFPADTEARADLAGTYASLIKMMIQLNRREDALKYVQAARLLIDQALRERPGDPKYLSLLAMIIGNASRAFELLGLPEESAKARREAIAYQRSATAVAADDEKPGYRIVLAKQTVGLAQAQLALGQNAEAAIHYQSALGEFEKLVNDEPSVTDYRSLMAACQNDYAALLANIGDNAAAVVALRKARAQQEALVAEHNNVGEYVEDLARTCNNLGELETRTGRFDAALADYQSVCDLIDGLIRKGRASALARTDLGATYGNLGKLFQKTSRFDDALAAYRRSTDVLNTQLMAKPSDFDAHNVLAQTLGNWGAAFREAGRVSDALGPTIKAVEHARAAVAGSKQAVEYRSTLGRQLAGLAEVYRALGRFQPAVASTRERLVIAPNDPEEHFSVACALALCQAPETAMEVLTRAAALGWHDQERLGTSRALDSLRGRPDFQQLVLRLMDLAMPDDSFAVIDFSSPAKTIPSGTTW